MNKFQPATADHLKQTLLAFGLNIDNTANGHHLNCYNKTCDHRIEIFIGPSTIDYYFSARQPNLIRHRHKLHSTDLHQPDGPDSILKLTHTWIESGELPNV